MGRGQKGLKGPKGLKGLRSCGLQVILYFADAVMDGVAGLFDGVGAFIRDSARGPVGGVAASEGEGAKRESGDDGNGFHGNWGFEP